MWLTLCLLIGVCHSDSLRKADSWYSPKDCWFAEGYSSAMSIGTGKHFVDSIIKSKTSANNVLKFSNQGWCINCGNPAPDSTKQNSDRGQAILISSLNPFAVPPLAINDSLAVLGRFRKNDIYESHLDILIQGIMREEIDTVQASKIKIFESELRKTGRPHYTLIFDSSGICRTCTPCISRPDENNAHIVVFIDFTERPRFRPFLLSISKKRAVIQQLLAASKLQKASGATSK